MHLATRNTPAAVRDVAVGRASVPAANLIRLGECDGDTVWLPRPGAATNPGPYRPRRRVADRNRMPAAFARHRIAA
ncbi:hypothetical protein [Micromonospora sonchi]|uniref:hypothetical protein n=1 Tax=Micromonospora sonchi TaxID=1763543 RepID=UPI00166979D5|nr:hypothetical protein [Micromonospora sonchi]